MACCGKLRKLATETARWMSAGNHIALIAALVLYLSISAYLVSITNQRLRPLDRVTSVVVV